jgi:phage shock protein C
MEKRLFRNEHNKTVAGVASGLADYMQVDITIIRVLFVLATIFLAGTGLLVYIVMWIVVPVNNDPAARYAKFNEYFEKNKQDPSMFNSPNAFNNPSNSGDQTKWNTPNAGPDFKDPNVMNQFPKGNDTGRTIGGLILLILGFYFLLRQFDVIPHWFNIFKIYKLWPLAIVALGISLIFRNQRKNEWDNFKKTTEEAQKTTTEKPVEDAIILEEDKDSATPNP